jgi:hypothetical protein
MIRVHLLAVVMACWSGCTERIQLDRPDGGLPGLVSLEVSPATTTLTIVDLAQPPQAVAYTATGTFEDGSSRDVTMEIAWTTDNDSPGAFVAAGNYHTSNAAAGHVGVIATSGTIAGTAALTVIVSLTIVDDVFPPPDGAADLFGSGLPVITADPMRSPVLVYPSNDTMFPQGLARAVFQYTRGMANDAFRLTFDSDVLHLVVLAGSDRWQPADEVWRLVGLSTAGGQVAVGVQALNTALPVAIYGNPVATLRWATVEPVGTIDFFSASTNGIMRGPLGATSASKLYPPANDMTCVGCHTISRDGGAMAFGYGGETLQTVNLPSLATEISAADKLAMGWATWSPSGDRLLVAARGVLTLYDPTGTPVGGAVPLPTGVLATHPDWSPDGSAVVVALVTTIDPMDMDVKGGSIAVLPYAADVWGAPQTVVTSSADNDNNFFPRWSPDGSAIAYVHAASSSRSAMSAELRVIAAAGGTPIPLRLASHRVGFTDDVPNVGDTMPGWIVAPGTTQWLAFASTRPYGVIRAMPGPAQIWLAGIDVARSAGTDPSFAAFWLPSQDIRVVNNNPIWAPTTSQ